MPVRARACVSGAFARARSTLEASDATEMRARMMMMMMMTRTRTTTTTTTTTTAADATEVARAVRRVNRRIALAVRAFAGTTDEAGWGRGAAGGTAARAAGERLFVWLHGYADVSGASWREFCEVVARGSGYETSIACPDAPRGGARAGGWSVGGDAPRAWFKPRLHVKRDGRAWTCDGLEDSVARVVRLVDEERARLGIERGDVVLGGFSQGACLALACAKRELSDVGGVLAVRGYLPNRSHEFSDIKPKTLILAGGNDPLVPLEWSLHAATMTGGDVVVRENLGHDLCVEDVFHARLWIHRRFRGQKTDDVAASP